MIQAKFFHQKHGICAFSLSGHSEYAEQGADIVCAAVSSIAQYVTEALEYCKIPLSSLAEDGLITCSLGEVSEDELAHAQEFLVPMEAVLSDLEIQYGKYLKICKLEV